MVAGRAAAGSLPAGWPAVAVPPTITAAVLAAFVLALHWLHSSETHAVTVFARNLRNLLLQPPVSGKRVLALDPGFKSGCKAVVVDECGVPQEHAVLHIIGQKEKREAAGKKIVELVEKHAVNVIAVGNGTAGRETETLVAELVAGDLAAVGREPGDHVRRAQDGINSVTVMCLRVTGGDDQQMQIVVAEHGNGARAQAFDETQHRQRMRPAVYQVADQPQTVACRIERAFVEQAAQRRIATLHIADCVNGHDVRRAGSR